MTPSQPRGAAPAPGATGSPAAGTGANAMAVRSYDAPLEPIQVPEPELRPGHALLEIVSCGVCFTDLKTSRGRMPYSDRLQLPHVPGHEICGRVIQSDPPVFDPGTLVVVYHLWPCRRCPRCRAGQEQLCQEPQGWTGFMTPGGFQHRLVAPLDRLAVVPPQIDPIHAAPLTCAVGTGYRAVVSRGRARPGDVAVVIGVGGVGIHGLQVAAAMGARAHGIEMAPRAREVAGAVGLTVHPAEDPETDERIRAAAEGDGADLVIDTVGTPETLERAFGLVRPGGRIVGVGYAVDSRITLPTARFVLEEIELVGSRYVGMEELNRAIRLVADGAVQTVIDRVLPLRAANEALDALEAGDVVGRVVLEVPG